MARTILNCLGSPTTSLTGRGFCAQCRTTWVIAIPNTLHTTHVLRGASSRGCGVALPSRVLARTEYTTSAMSLAMLPGNIDDLPRREGGNLRPRRHAGV